MLLTTTSTLQDRHIDDYKGVVSGEAILGANAFRDMFAGIRDIVGGRSAAYERELQEAKDLAISEMVERARDTGANAVIGIDLDYETVGQNGSMLMVTASGTAVVVTQRIFERITQRDAPSRLSPTMRAAVAMASACQRDEPWWCRMAEVRAGADEVASNRVLCLMMSAAWMSDS